MNKTRAGFLVLILVIVSVGGAFALARVLPFLGDETVAMLVMPEALLIIPAIGMLVCYEPEWAGIKELLQLRPIGFMAGFMVVVITIVFSPVTTTLNLLSQIFVKNEAVDAMSGMLEVPGWILVLLIGIFAPLCEEFVFRGVIYGALRRTSNIRGAMVLQALLFGLFHGNLNQFLYAFALGLIMAYLVEATGSIMASVMLHMVVNTSNVMLILMAKSVVPTEELMGQMADGRVSADKILSSLPQLLLGVAVSLFITFVLCKKLSELCGRWDEVKKILSNRAGLFEGLMSVPMILAMLFMTVMLIADTVIQIL